MNESIYKTYDFDATLWQPIIEWIIQQVDMIDFRELGEPQEEERPFVVFEGEA